MSLQNKINDDIKNAMKTKNTVKLSVLRAIKSAIMVELAKDGSRIIADNLITEIIIKLVKQRRDSAKIFSEQGRQDLVDVEINELAILKLYMPKLMNEQEIRKSINNILIQANANSIADFGKCMGMVMNKLKGKADGTMISKIVREQLSK